MYPFTYPTIRFSIPTSPGRFSKPYFPPPGRFSEPYFPPPGRFPEPCLSTPSHHQVDSLNPLWCTPPLLITILPKVDSLNLDFVDDEDEQFVAVMNTGRLSGSRTNIRWSANSPIARGNRGVTGG
eukprot:sb/3475683/